MAVADLLQLPTVRGKVIFPQHFDKDNMKQLLGFQLQHLFKHTELTEVVRQNNILFIELLSKVDIDEDVEK